MKKSLYIMALGAIALTSCSQDEIIEVKKDAISFATATENASRATIYDATNLTAFNVSGIVKDGVTYKTYFDKITMNDGTKEGSIYNSGYYWPMGNMDFYAYAPTTLSFVLGEPDAAASKTGDKAAKITGVTIPTDATTQADIVYALSTNNAKPATANPVDLNFRHALSQVDFKVKIDANVAQAIKVVVNSITVKNLQGTGVYSFPTTETDTGTDGKGTWAISGELTDYSVTPGWGALTNGATGKTEAVTATATKSMLLLPQTIEASTYSSGWSAKGLFILEADVYSVVGGTEVQLVSEPTYVPVEINWEEGKHYTYTFVYSADGNGGKTDDNEDQLIPIQFRLSVDDFAPTTPAETPVPLR